jgi:hypothetical protein
MKNKLYHYGIFQEGMISYNQSSSSLNQIVIPQYSAQPVYKLYDSIYFDAMNGNVLELFGTSYSNSNVDMTGSSLTDMTLLARIPTKLSSSTYYQATVEYIDLSFGSILSPMVNTGLIPNTTISSYLDWIYPMNLDIVAMPSDTTTVPQYQILYFPWGTKTIVHIFNFVVSENIATYYFRQSLDPIHSLSTCNVSMPTTYQGNSNTHDLNTYVKISEYFEDRYVFQVSDHVFFDPNNRYLLMTSSDGLILYDGTMDSNGPVKISMENKALIYAPYTFQEFNVVYMEDTEGKNIILYIPVSSTKILIAVLCVDPTNTKLLSIKNVVRFNTESSNGVDGLPNVTTPTATNKKTVTSSTTTSTTSTSTQKDISSNTTTPSNYYQQPPYSYDKQSGRNSEDYMLKTQLIPPICPACPACPASSCPNSVICTNCGGHGGSGTYDICYNLYGNGGLGIASGISNIGNATVDIGERIGKDVVHGGSTIGNGVLNTGERLGNDILYGGSKVGQGILDTGERIGSNVVHVGENVASGVIDTVEDVGSGVWNGVKDVGSGIQHAFALHPTNVQNNGNMMNGGGYSNYGRMINGRNGEYSNGVFVPKGVDMYNYHGQLSTDISSNFIPLTSDFSKFGR